MRGTELPHRFCLERAPQLLERFDRIIVEVCDACSAIGLDRHETFGRKRLQRSAHRVPGRTVPLCHVLLSQRCV